MEGNLVAALDQVFAETVALFQSLRSVAATIHSHGDLSQEERTVLQGLDRDGACTSANIAEDCGVSKQAAQKLVKSLQKRGVVELVPNPDNKRTKRVDLTEDGRTLIRALDQREVELLSMLPVDASVQDLHAGAQALAAVRSAMEDAAWRKLLNNGDGG